MTQPPRQRGHPISTKLVVPADMRFLGMAQGYIRDLALVSGFPEQEALALELAAEEAFVNIVQHAYPGQRPGDVFWESEITQTELTVTIRDEGLPFQPSPAMGAQAPRADAGQEDLGQGLGLRLIRHAVDEARFENLGHRGKALRLIKHRRSAGMEPGPEVQSPPRLPLAPEQSYEFRLMRPEEAMAVARLFWLTYGYSYKNEAIYRPEGVLHLVGSGRLVSIVAVAEDGEVVGHAGLLRPEPVPMAEAALLVVSPAHRGRGLMVEFAKATRATAVEMGLRGLAFNPVTSHAISQKEAIRTGAIPCGLELAVCLPLRFKALQAEDAPGQRESCLNCFQYFAAPPPATVHLPARHRKMAARIFEALGQPCTWGEAAPSPDRGEFLIDFDRNAQKGLIKVRTADERQWPEILRAARDLEEVGGAEVVDLDLPLAQPATALLCRLAEDAGFFFSGLKPCEALDGDNLRLQRLKEPLDLSRLRIYSDLGQEIFAHVAKQFAEAQAKPRA